jgi:hypothetical protein
MAGRPLHDVRLGWLDGVRKQAGRAASRYRQWIWPCFDVAQDRARVRAYSGRHHRRNRRLSATCFSQEIPMRAIALAACLLCLGLFATIPAGELRRRRP